MDHDELTDLYKGGVRLPCRYTGHVEELSCGCEVEESDEGPGVYIRICEPHRIELSHTNLIKDRGKRIAYRKDAVSD